jgi:hypothetical protein
VRLIARAVVLLLVLLATLVLAACSDPTDGNEPIGEAPIELTRSGGCGDAYLWAATDDGTWVVTIGVEARDRSSTEPTTIAVDLPDPDIRASVLVGDVDLTRNLCTDVIDGDAEPNRTVPVVSGSGEIVLDPTAPEGTYDLCGDTSGRAELRDVRSEEGTPFSPFTIETDGIGCYAG